MQIGLAIFLITLGLGQLISSHRGWRAASLVGPNRWLGYGVGVGLVVLGAGGVIGLSLPGRLAVLAWPLLTGPLALALLLLAGSFVKAPTHPDHFFTPEHPEHGSCQRLDISDGDDSIPAFLLRPLPEQQSDKAVCLVHGSGDNKRGFKWRLVRALLAEGLTVLTIDLPGHGDYSQRLLAYPDCLSTIPAALQFLRAQPGIERVGLLGISLGGAVALKSLATQEPGETSLVDALAILETPLWVKYNRALVRREAWQALRTPILSLFKEMSLRQLQQSWREGRIRSRHSTEEMFNLLNPLESIRQLDPAIPLLLVYSQRDPIAPLSFGRALQEAAPQAELITVTSASHVTLILMPQVNRQVASWLRKRLQK